jgi:hypothetical protein
MRKSGSLTPQHASRGSFCTLSPPAFNVCRFSDESKITPRSRPRHSRAGGNPACQKGLVSCLRGNGGNCFSLQTLETMVSTLACLIQMTFARPPPDLLRDGPCLSAIDHVSIFPGTLISTGRDG